MIREFETKDTANTAGVWLRSGLEEYKYLPDFQKLDEPQAIEIFAKVIMKKCQIWVYEFDGEICGFIAMNGSYIDRLYVDPKHQRCGIGATLVRLAKRISPKQLELHTHQQNDRARSFYEKFGFVSVKFGVSPPPESVPDVEYHWRNPSAA